MTVLRRLALLVALSMSGCFMEVETWSDSDGDGVPDEADCGPADPETYAGAADPHGDGIDTNCDGTDGLDFDGDGYPGNADEEESAGVLDCDDADDTVHPGADDPEGDDVDSDCDGVDG